MTALSGQHVLLGVTGGIAAYKSPDLVRRLRDAGAEVRVVMTEGARAFVQPLTFQAVSGKPVHHDLLDSAAEAAMGHIELARWAHRVLVAPASADFMARLAHGLANDLLTTLCLATDAEIVIAPSMNRLMWANAATQDNARILVERGIRQLGPGVGNQACGEVGSGRMWEPLDIVAALNTSLDGPLAGRQVLVTAGPTREAIDPVRYLTNRSSGRMGFAIAAAASRLGARVTLVAGPTGEPTPAGVERHDVESAAQMYDAVMSRYASADIFIAAAAVADYRAADTAGHKLKKTPDSMNLSLVRTPDILASVAGVGEGRPYVVGFAAETDNLAENAHSKLREKRLDMIAANWVGRSDSGFDTENNALEVLTADDRVSLPIASKQRVAEQLMTLIADRYLAYAGGPP